MSTVTLVSLIVPAHNEAKGIVATLLAIQQATDRIRQSIGENRHAFELIVACNGCSDGTAELAREAAPQAVVLDIPQRGKANALNEAMAVAKGRSLLIIDADTHPDDVSLKALATALDEPGTLAVSPGVVFDLAAASPIVRSCYKVFAEHPYLLSGVGGAGVYGLSEQGKAALGKLPLVNGDDEFIRRFLPASSQRRVRADRSGRPVSIVVRPPASLAALLRAERRSRYGDREVRALLSGSMPESRTKWLLRAAQAHPIDLIVFVAFKVFSRAYFALTPANRTQGWVPSRD